MKIVEYEGPLDAHIYIIGEAPGAEEEETGVPFSGGAGRILDRLLMDSGIVRGECRIANVMRVRPPNNDFSVYYDGKVPSTQLLEGIRYLVEDIKKTRPWVVCALGNEAMKALFGFGGITDWRGSIMWCEKIGCKVIPTVHPALIMRQWDFAPLALFDFKRLREESETPNITIPKREIVIGPSFERIMTEIERLKTSEKVSFDIETVETTEGGGITPHITAIAFSDNPFWAICIPFTSGTEPYWSDPVQEIAIWKAVKGLLEDPKPKKIAQNAQFDMAVLQYSYGIKVANLWMDTMCAHHTVYPELPKALAVICSIYTRQPFYKHWAKQGGDVTFWRYNGMDACVTYEAAIAIEKDLKEYSLDSFYWERVHPLIEVFLDIQLRGTRVDLAVRSKAAEEVANKTNLLQSELEIMVGRPISANSPKQIKELLKEMGIPLKVSRTTGKETTDEDALLALSAKYPSPIFDIILGIRRNKKMLSTYLQAPLSNDGRIRTSYMIGGTETGRISSRESIFGSGTNLQNIPKGVCRKMFVPDEGKVFLEADLSQAEARVVAYLSGEERLIELFSRGGDIHRQTASWLFSKEVDKVTYEERDLSKRLVHASNYGIGPRTFAAHAGVKEARAKELLSTYFSTFPNIRRWQLEIQAELRRSRWLMTPMGRKRLFFGRWGEDLFREAYAFKPQSTVADILNLAMLRFISANKEKGLRGEVMLQVHDSFVAQCDKEKVNETLEIIREAFNLHTVIMGRTLTIPVDIKVGVNWDEMKEVTNG